MPLIPFLLFLSLLAVAAGVFRIWAREATKQKLQDFFVGAWIRIDDYDTAVLVKKPISLLSHIADRYCGAEIWSIKPIMRMAKVTFVLTIVSLLALWSISGKPFGTTESPVEEFVESAKNLEKFATTETGKTPEEKAKLLADWKQAKESWPLNFYLYLSRPENRFLHGSLMLLASIVVVLSVSALCWSHSRYMLRRMLVASDAWSLCAYFCLNVFVIAIVTTAGSGLLAFIVYAPARMLYMVSSAMPFNFQLIGHVVLPLITLYFAAPWFQIVIGVCLLPTIAVGGLLLMATAAQLWRQPVYRIVNAVFLRMAEFRNGPVEWISSLVAVLLGLLAMYKLFQE
jgi:hypothetical protein